MARVRYKDLTTGTQLSDRFSHVKFRFQNGEDWPQMGQIYDFFTSGSVHFGLAVIVKFYLKNFGKFLQGQV